MGKFLQQMLFGMQASGDIKLSNIGRALEESISLKKAEERWSRNLKCPDLDRNLGFGSSEFLAENIAGGCRTPHIIHIIKETREGEKTYKLEFGMRKVRMLGRDEPLALVVVHGFGEKPLMLLTNLAVTHGRKSLWRIVEGYLSR